jgi:CheY-like chemotaxis protein/anti-sigma regulatory factor (Ser/Thr protein kinase)
VDLNALLLEEVRLLERTTLAKVHLELDLAPDLRPIHGDGSALAHAFMNLCVNAVDAMGEGGTLTFQTHNREDQQVEVVVADTGCGMTQEVMARAMDPFFTTKEAGKGTGLGLSMVYTTVKAHGGQITLQSEPGRSTTVRLTFPACAARDAGQAAPAPVRPVAAAPALRILLVDDDELVLKSTRMLVELLGHAVTAAALGEEALDLIERGYRADLVILDMNMPGLGGKGTLPRLRALCPRVPVLLATGRTDQEALDLVAGYPSVTLLAKPFTIQDLGEALRQVEEERRG